MFENTFFYEFGVKKWVSRKSQVLTDGAITNISTAVEESRGLNFKYIKCLAPKADSGKNETPEVIFIRAW